MGRLCRAGWRALSPWGGCVGDAVVRCVFCAVILPMDTDSNTYVETLICTLGQISFGAVLHIRHSIHEGAKDLWFVYNLYVLSNAYSRRAPMAGPQLRQEMATARNGSRNSSDLQNHAGHDTRYAAAQHVPPRAASRPQRPRSAPGVWDDTAAPGTVSGHPEQSILRESCTNRRTNRRRAGPLVVAPARRAVRHMEGGKRDGCMGCAHGARRRRQMPPQLAVCAHLLLDLLGGGEGSARRSLGENPPKSSLTAHPWCTAGRPRTCPDPSYVGGSAVRELLLPQVQHVPAQGNGDIILEPSALARRRPGRLTIGHWCQQVI
eukprot:COSAG01_NODE_9707_length_2364_cov_31.572185_3_plen_320_part_00